jgi:hypothetical protein
MRVVALLPLAILAGCASPAGETASTAGPTFTAPAAPTVTGVASVPVDGPVDELPDGVTAELVITRQRDLIDRGLINVMTVNGSAGDVVVTGRRLVADSFETPAARPRLTTLRAGRAVALQVPYGVATDCTTDAPVDAVLRITYLTEGDPAERTADVDLAGTDILDRIRAEQCTARAFDATVDVAVGEPVVDERSVTATVTLTPTGDDTAVSVERAGGTIMFGVASEGVPAAVDATTGPVEIPVTFSVNRCDPHAIAEVTKRYGLEFDVAIDGRSPQPVDIDVGPVIPALDVILERCRAAGRE